MLSLNITTEATNRSELIATLKEIITQIEQGATGDGTATWEIETYKDEPEEEQGEQRYYGIQPGDTLYNEQDHYLGKVASVDEYYSFFIMEDGTEYFDDGTFYTKTPVSIKLPQ